jgi:hypothetical protein
MQENSTSVMQFDIADLVRNLETISCNAPDDEARLLRESLNYTYDSRSVVFYFANAETRYKRYIKYINFDETGHGIIRESILYFLSMKENYAVLQIHAMNIVKNIDRMILSAIETL